MRSSTDRLLGRTPDEWFADAVRCYLEQHQGCPCCGARHCVFRSLWGTRVEYYCTACDFSAACDAASRYCTATCGDCPASPDVPLALEPAL
jgi:hypothetical protein